MRNFKDYGALRTFLKSLSVAEIKAYRDNGRRFLQSKQVELFGKEHFVKTVFDACSI